MSGESWLAVRPKDSGKAAIRQDQVFWLTPFPAGHGLLPNMDSTPCRVSQTPQETVE